MDILQSMRTRITFTKFGAMQYVGHLALHRSWERTFRRAGLPLAYSLGFHPQPRLNIACALPLGFTSGCELLDAWLEQEIPINQLIATLSEAAPPGVAILTAEQVDLHEPSLQTQVVSAIYAVTFLDETPDLQERGEKLASAAQLLRPRHTQ